MKYFIYFVVFFEKKVPTLNHLILFKRNETIKK